jgi:hypothetical protein
MNLNDERNGHVNGAKPAVAQPNVRSPLYHRPTAGWVDVAQVGSGCHSREYVMPHLPGAGEGIEFLQGRGNGQAKLPRHEIERMIASPTAATAPSRLPKGG